MCGLTEASCVGSTHLVVRHVVVQVDLLQVIPVGHQLLDGLACVDGASHILEGQGLKGGLHGRDTHISITTVNANTIVIIAAIWSPKPITTTTTLANWVFCKRAQSG